MKVKTAMIIINAGFYFLLLLFPILYIMVSDSKRANYPRTTLIW